ncbi:hypothetical protein BELL_0970g00040 [Botrytis elliptica]|uniref:Uncharacterized protein n=1 Tax=Botrytis elliptica TaxID=278938 RepID=A0A4Z1IXX8_9HELO|nr:hypothetical protein EAE99_009835 [Botrytis elliptica]TGO66259.1 hypothetical protein BELL_0970g00040 [Botrytis elliptica]
MSPSRNKSTALAPTGDKVQRAGKRLTRGNQISGDQAIKIRKLRLQSLQKIKKREADHTITKMLNKLRREEKAQSSNEARSL